MLPRTHRFLIISLTLVSSYARSTITLKPHEQWWEKNVQEKITIFDGWLGDEEADSRVQMRNHIVHQQYKSVLDIPCGLCTEYIGYIKHTIDIQYFGVDITPQLVERAQSMGVYVVQGSIETIPFDDSSVDVCYARHILEHLDYYHHAVDELIRVAAKEVIIIFFIKPTEAEDMINGAMIDGALLFHNHYNKTLIDAYIARNDKVATTHWQDLNSQEVALHIYIKQ